MSTYYVIENIQKKSLPPGDIFGIHKDMIGRECYIVDLREGFRCLMYVDVGTEFRPVLTSTVIKCSFYDGGIDLETKNTYYKLKVLSNGKLNQGIHTRL